MVIPLLELDIARADTSAFVDNTPAVVPAEPEKKPNFIQRLFGKKDTTARKKEEEKELEVDTVGKTKKQIRQEKRALKKQLKQLDNESKENGGE